MRGIVSRTVMLADAGEDAPSYFPLNLPLGASWALTTDYLRQTGKQW